MDQSLEGQLTSIEERLLRLERYLGMAPQAAKPAARNAPASSTPTYQSAAPAASYERKPGNWLGLLAVVCFVVAAGFIIKLSIDTGWLTPARQIGIATLLGMTLIGSGLALLNSDREYSSFLPGAGVIVLYLTAFAAHRYYGLVSFEAALAATALVSAFCIWLYLRIGHDVYAITAAVGAYASPVLLGMHAANVFTLYYFLVCSLAFAIISIWVEARLMTVIAAYLSILMTSLIGMDLHQDKLIAIVLFFHFLIFSAGTYLYSSENDSPMSEAEAWAFFPVLLIFYAAEYFFIERIQPGLAPWVSLAFAGGLISLYMLAHNRFGGKNIESLPVVLAFATVVGFHSVYLELLPEAMRHWLFALIMIAFALFPSRYSARLGGDGFSIPKLGILAVLAIEYMTMVYNLIDNRSLYWLTVSFVSLASIWGVLLTKQGSYGLGLLSAAHLLAVMALFQLADPYGSLAVSACWLAYATAVMALAFARKDEMMAKSALFVLGFAAGKALLYDAAGAATVVRILCLLMTGAVLYGCGFLMRRIGSWGK